MKRLLIPLIGILFLPCCTKEAQLAQDETSERTVTIRVKFPESDATKVAFTADQEKLSLSWQPEDCIRVISGNQSSVFTISNIISAHEAEFTGVEVSGTSFDILVPGTYSTVAEAEADTATPAQDGNGSTAHLAYKALLTGVDNCTDIAFSASWAAEHGGSFKSGAVVKLQATLPQGVSSLKSVSINLKGSEYSLPLSHVDVSGSAQKLTAYMMLPWNDINLPDGSVIIVSAVDEGDEVYSAIISPSGEKTIMGGRMNSIKNVELALQTQSDFAGGSGTAADPYLIANTKQLLNMMNLYKDANDPADAESFKYWFKLIADVDASTIDWVPLNTKGPYYKAVDFDGGGHSIIGLRVESTNGYPSFAGVLNGSVRNVVFDSADIEAGNNTAGVVAGYIGTSGVSGSCSGVTVKDSNVHDGAKNRVGGLAGYAAVVDGDITDCHVINTTVTSTMERVGGLIGQVDKGINVIDCTAEDITAEGLINIGGLIGVGYGNCTDCTSSGSVSSINSKSNNDIGLGGLVGYLEHGTISQCSSSVEIYQTTNGRDIGGLVGKMLAATVEKSFATGDITGAQRNVGGLIGLITLTSGKAVVRDCYCTGDVVGNAHSGGFLGLHEKGTAEISNCYAAGSASGSFGMGGMVGYNGANALTMTKCAAWGAAVTATATGLENWSSGSVVGITSPNSTLIDNYRNPDMVLTAFWVPAAGYNHADVQGTEHPLVRISEDKSSEAETGKTALDSSATEAGRWGYHGKVAPGKTLSELASDVLGWDASIWDFSGSLPKLR